MEIIHHKGHFIEQQSSYVLREKIGIRTEYHEKCPVPKTYFTFKSV